MNTGVPENQSIRLSQFSHGAGCGCKIAPSVLSKILAGNETGSDFPQLLVGNNSRDDAAVWDLQNGQALISTTDFFTPIVDDAYDFGRIAAANALSDVYAMGGKPVMAIAILGWPVEKLPAELAQQVVAGGREVCAKAGIPLAGGHSIDTPEPVFGLAVNGLVNTGHLKRNDTPRIGDHIFITKKIGSGILATAAKQNQIASDHLSEMVKSMCALNSLGTLLGKMNGVTALTDITGFGIAGHLVEMMQSNHLTAQIQMNKIPLFSGVQLYQSKGFIPGGTYRNWNGYGDRVKLHSEMDLLLVCDPQTSGGLMITVRPEDISEVIEVSGNHGTEIFDVGRVTAESDRLVEVFS
jgi:selenide, water dikinase